MATWTIEEVEGENPFGRYPLYRLWERNDVTLFLYGVGSYPQCFEIVAGLIGEGDFYVEVSPDRGEWGIVVLPYCAFLDDLIEIRRFDAGDV